MSWHEEHDEEMTPEALDAALDAWPGDALGRRIADAARDYNAPTAEVPRDAMWAAIVGARIPATPDAAPAVVPPLRIERTTVRPAARPAAAVDRRRTWWALAAAAAIFLATGVGIGRWWGAAGGVSSATTPVPAPQVASAPSAPASASPATTPATTPALTPRDGEPAAPRERVNVERPAATVATVAPAATVARAAVPGAGRTPDPYDMAVTRHFTQAEALLVSYRADTVDAAMDVQLARWARPLLSNTQMLLDSPAADDPRRRRVLEDLELVLAQVARLAPTPRDTSAIVADTAAASAGTRRADRLERQIIDGTLQRAQLLPRLRNLVASGS